MATASEGQNSYVSLDFADTFFEDRLYTSEWDNLDDTEKDTALIWACTLMENRVKWKGKKTDSSQTLQWPRTGLLNHYGEPVDETTIPQTVKAVQCELALYLLQNNPMVANSGIKSMDLDGMTLNLSSSRETIPHKIFQPISIWGQLLDAKGTVGLTR